jgi:hypothetical protein
VSARPWIAAGCRDVRPELRPRREAVLARDHPLRFRQLQRGPRAERGSHALQGCRLSLKKRGEQRLGLALEPVKHDG